MGYSTEHREYSDEYMTATADAYAQTLRVILDEALRHEGFWLEATGGGDECNPVTYLDLNWRDSEGQPRYRVVVDLDG